MKQQSFNLNDQNINQSIDKIKDAKYKNYKYYIDHSGHHIMKSIQNHQKGINFILECSFDAQYKKYKKNEEFLTYELLEYRFQYWRKKNPWLKELHRNPINCAIHHSINIFRKNPRRKNFPTTPQCSDVRFYEHFYLSNNKLKLPISEYWLNVIPFDDDVPLEYTDIRNVIINFTPEGKLFLNVFATTNLPKTKKTFWDTNLDMTPEDQLKLKQRQDGMKSWIAKKKLDRKKLNTFNKELLEKQK